MSTHSAHEQDPSRFMTVHEIAVELRISRASVYRLVHDGTLQGNRFGKNLRVARAVVEAYLRDSVPGERRLPPGANPASGGPA